MSKFTATVREDGYDEITVIFHDENGNELGSIVAARVQAGVRLDCWNANDTHADTVVVRS